MKIIILICGEGLGHTSRCLALGKEFLAAGHEVHFGAYGYSKEMVEKTGYSAHEIPSEIKLLERLEPWISQAQLRRLSKMPTF